MTKKCHIWVGRFSSKEVFEKFFEESYGNDARSISDFAKSQNTRFYDHDWLESYYEPEYELSILLADLKSDARTKVMAEIGKVNFTINTLVNFLEQDLERLEFVKPSSISTDNVELLYLGLFDSTLE